MYLSYVLLIMRGYIADMRIGDELTVLPQEICPEDGVVLDGHGIMNEA